MQPPLSLVYGTLTSFGKRLFHNNTHSLLLLSCRQQSSTVDMAAYSGPGRQEGPECRFRHKTIVVTKNSTGVLRGSYVGAKRRDDRFSKNCAARF